MLPVAIIGSALYQLRLRIHLHIGNHIAGLEPFHKACFTVTRFGDFCFANTPEELQSSLIYYDRVQDIRLVKTVIFHRMLPVAIIGSALYQLRLRIHLHIAQTRRKNYNRL